MTEEQQDQMFFALAHTTRRQILDIVKRMPGCSVADIAKYFPASRIAVMKHLAVLEAADLLVSRKTGRVREYLLNAAPIQQIIDRWTTEYAAFWASRAMDLKYALEGAVAPPSGPASSARAARVSLPAPATSAPTRHA